MIKVLIFSHEADLDGLYSAAIGLLRYPQAMTVFLGYGAENFQKMGNFIYSATHFSKERGLVIIADLGLNDDTIEICRGIFDDAVRNGWKLMWVDHHPWSQAALDMARQYCEELVHDPSGKKCAADLMADKLLPGNELAASLASMAHTMDFFTKDQYLTPITELIKYYQTFPNFYERLAELAKKSAEGILWDVEMQGEYVKYTKLRDEAKLQALSSMQVRQVGNSGVKVAFVPASPYLQSSLFSEEVLAATGADLVLFYSSRGKVSIRRSGDKISCRQVAANLHEGGGHDYAAGATFKSDPSDVAAVVAELESAVSRALSSNASNTLKEQPPNP